MKNTSFMFKTEEEKTVKLITLLRQRSRGTLSGEQLNQLALAVKTGRQYTVRIHTTPSGFCESLVLVKSDTDNDVGTVVFGQALFGAATESGYREGRLFLPSRQACAVVSRKRADGRPPAGKTVKLKILGTGMISVMPVPLLAAHPRECSPQGRTRYVPSACACRWTCQVHPHRPP